VTDRLTRKKRSQVMAAIHSTGNRATELRLAAVLRANGLAGWRRRQQLPGKPDFVFRRERLAVFVDGCFWHGCRWHCRMPKSKQTYWEPKILRNRIRDREIRTILRRTGWSIHRIWEHSLADPVAVATKLRRALRSSARKALKAS
jgi:DNA mismatch endonuclease, patch repair protein